MNDLPFSYAEAIGRGSTVINDPDHVYSIRRDWADLPVTRMTIVHNHSAVVTCRGLAHVVILPPLS